MPPPFTSVAPMTASSVTASSSTTSAVAAASSRSLAAACTRRGTHISASTPKPVNARVRQLCGSNDAQQQPAPWQHPAAVNNIHHPAAMHKKPMPAAACSSTSRQRQLCSKRWAVCSCWKQGAGYALCSCSRRVSPNNQKHFSPGLGPAVCKRLATNSRRLRPSFESHQCGQ